MTAFVVKSRTTLPDKEETVEADTRELAIDQVLKAAPEGAHVEIMSVVAEAEPEPKEEPPHAKAKSKHHDK